MKTIIKIVIILVFFFLSVKPSYAQNYAEYWYGSGTLKGGLLPVDFEEMWKNPQLWTESQNYMDAYILREYHYRKFPKVFTDEFLTNYFIPTLKSKNIKFGLNVYHITFARCTGIESRLETVVNQELQTIKRFEDLGLKVDYLFLTSILSQPTQWWCTINPYPYEKRLDDAVYAIRTIKAAYPHIKVGINGALPRLPREDTEGDVDWKEIYGRLFNKLEVVNQILDFFVLDISYRPGHENNWVRAKEAFDYFKEKGIFFAMEYAENPCHSREDYYENIMKEYIEAKIKGIYPNAYLVMNWSDVPDHELPENPTSTTGKDYTLLMGFTRLGRRLVLNNLIKSVPKGDLNQDKIVNNLDFDIFKPKFGLTGSNGFTESDIDKNGKVDIFDYSLLVNNFGQ